MTTQARETFVIRKSFLVPLGILLAQTLTLFGVGTTHGEPRGKMIILGLIILPVAVVFIESLFRKVSIDPDRIAVDKFFRRRSISFTDVTGVETVQVRKRVFLTIWAEERFILLSNAYADFPRLMRSLISRVPPEALSEDTRATAANPPVKTTDVISCWLAVALMTMILYIQFGGRLPG